MRGCAGRGVYRHIKLFLGDATSCIAKYTMANSPIRWSVLLFVQSFRVCSVRKCGKKTKTKKNYRLIKIEQLKTYWVPCPVQWIWVVVEAVEVSMVGYSGKEVVTKTTWRPLLGLPSVQSFHIMCRLSTWYIGHHWPRDISMAWKVCPSISVTTRNFIRGGNSGHF